MLHFLSTIVDLQWTLCSCASLASCSPSVAIPRRSVASRRTLMVPMLKCPMSANSASARAGVKHIRQKHWLGMMLKWAHSLS